MKASPKGARSRGGGAQSLQGRGQRGPDKARPAEKAVERTYATNRRARYEYAILETLEVGVALTGTEIKSVRAGRANLSEGYVRAEGGELWLLGTHISTYGPGSRSNHEPTRPRKLLAHTREIARLAGQASQPGFTLVPLRLYDRSGYVKVLLAVGRGKRQYEKRETIAKRDAEREMARAMRRER